MGYFPNGTAGEVYWEKYCARCVHWKPEPDNEQPGCPVWDLHLLFNYDQDDKTKRVVLGHLIPRDENGWNTICRMLWEKP